MIKNIFGTEGIRAKVGQDYLTSEKIIKIGNAISLWAIKKFNKPKILLGSDTRISASWMKANLKSGLLQNNVKLFDADILSTPAIFKILQIKSFFDCAIIITASHNPYVDNGIKIVNKNGEKLTKEDELYISKIFHQKQNINYKEFGRYCYFPLAKNIYINQLKKRFSKKFLKGIRIVIDCANGAVYKIAPQLFKYFGADLITINNKPNGKNINNNCGTLYPEKMAETVLKTKADIGFSFDGDGDRIIISNKKGEIKTGDDILTLLLQNPIYAKEKEIVSTIIANYGLEKYLKEKLIRTAVGEKAIVQKLHEKNLLLGGEPSGHIIARDYLNTSDGIFIALLILDTIIYNNNWDLKTFNKIPQITLNIPIKFKKNLKQPPFSNIILESQKKLKYGRIIIRYSGTEPLLRIMVETNNKEKATYIGKNLANKLQKELI